MNKAGTRSAIDSDVTSKDSFIILVFDFFVVDGLAIAHSSFA